VKPTKGATSSSSLPIITSFNSGYDHERWKDKVKPEVYEKMNEHERQRQEVIFELYRTEKEYLRDLDVIIDVPFFFLLFFSFFKIFIYLFT